MDRATSELDELQAFHFGSTDDLRWRRYGPIVIDTSLLKNLLGAEQGRLEPQPARSPKIKMPRVPEALAKDMKLKQTVLAYVYKGDELRMKTASGVPRASRSRPAGMAGAPGQPAPNVSRDEPQRGGRGGRDAR